MSDDRNDESLFASEGSMGSFPSSPIAGVNPPLPDQGQYDGENGEGLDEPEEQPGVGN